VARVVRMCDLVAAVVVAGTVDVVSRSAYLRADHTVGWVMLGCPEKLQDSCIGLRHIWRRMRM